jgi:hypothetical protein
MTDKVNPQMRSLKVETYQDGVRAAEPGLNRRQKAHIHHGKILLNSQFRIANMKVMHKKCCQANSKTAKKDFFIALGV